MKKKISFLFTLLMGVGICTSVQTSYANIDNYASVNYSYECEKGRGILTVDLKYGSQTVTTKTYNINRAGYVLALEQDDPTQWYWTFGLNKEKNAYIPGCGCSESSTQTTNYPSLLTQNGSGGTVASDYIFTTGTGNLKEGLKLADTIVFTPKGNGLPSSCSGTTNTGSTNTGSTNTGSTNTGSTSTGVCTTSGSIAISSVSGYPKVDSGSTGSLTLLDITPGTRSTVRVRCTAGYKSTTTIPVYPHRIAIKCNSASSTGSTSFDYSYSGVLMNRIHTEETTCIYDAPGTYTVSCSFSPVTGFSPGFPSTFADQRKITISTNSTGACSTQTGTTNTGTTNTGTTNGGNTTACTASNCRYTFYGSSFTTRSTDVSIPLLKGLVSSSCTLSTPTISCTQGAGATIETSSSTTTTSPNGTQHTVRIPASIASKAGTCTLSYTSSCSSSPLTETITIGTSPGGGGSTGTSSTSTSSLAPVVTIWASATTLSGMVTNLTATNASSCMEVVGRTSGSNSDMYCRDGDASHWRVMPANGWEYAASARTWNIIRTVGSGTDLPAGNYRGYWRNNTTGLTGSTTFTIPAGSTSTSAAPVVTMLVSGSALQGTVKNLTATNASACMEVVGRSSGTNSDTYCQDGVASHWTKMPAGGWKYSATSGTWNLTQTVGYNTELPPGDYRGYWRNDTTGVIGKTSFTISSFGSASSDLAPSVAFSVSENILKGTVTNLNINNAAACMEMLGRTTGVNAEGYCNSDDSHWTKMTSSNANWKYDVATSTWNGYMLVGSTSDIPTGRYVGYWKNTDSGLIGKASFTVDDTAGVIILGSLGGSQKSMFNAGSIDTTAYSSLLMKIRSNVANLVKGMQNGEVANGILYYKSDTTLPYSTIADKDFKTLVVYGDLRINQNIGAYKGIIVLKNGTSGGNIYVGDDVTYIKGALLAEGMFRGMSNSASTPNPSEQLRLEGALFSRNTIGGSINPNNLYTYPNVSTADKDAAFVNDLYRVRSKGTSRNYYTGYRNPFIIEYSTTLLYNPPPGF